MKRPMATRHPDAMSQAAQLHAAAAIALILVLAILNGGIV